MAAKAILVLCAQALLPQIAFSQCLAGIGGLGYGAGLAGPGLAGGLGGGRGCGGVASTGGGLPVASASPIPPVGVSLLSENVYEGGLCAGGNLPFLGTVGIQGVLPTAGAGAVSYGCGNGALGIAGEAGPIVTGIASPNTYAPGIGGIGGIGLGGIGCGAGLGGIGYGAGLGGIGYGAGLGGIGIGAGLGGIGIGAGLGGIGIGGCGCGGAWL